MKVVFLDIDGVLQPKSCEDNFYAIDESARRLVRTLSEKYNVDYSQYNIYDILPTYYDWHPQAIARLKMVLESTNSKIIVSSDWKKKEQPYKMRELLRIHDLDKYWFADNIEIKEGLLFHETRHLEIEDSLHRYPIDNFVVLDDVELLGEYYPQNSVITHGYISVSDMNECIKILKK